MVPEMGIEPIWCYHHQILSLARLPFRHSGTRFYLIYPPFSRFSSGEGKIFHPTGIPPAFRAESRTGFFTSPCSATGSSSYRNAASHADNSPPPYPAARQSPPPAPACPAALQSLPPWRPPPPTSPDMPPVLPATPESPSTPACTPAPPAGGTR